MNLGYILSLLLFLCITVSVIWAVVFKRSRDWYEFLPTFFWQSIMASSFLYQYNSFDERFVSIQALAIAIFSVFIFASDWVLLPRINWLQTRFSIKLLHLAYTLLFLSVALQISHLYFMPEIPLVTVIMDKAQRLTALFFTGQKSVVEQVLQAERYMKLRENSSKLLDMPLLYIYLCQATLLVFAPFALHILAKKKKWFWASIFLMFCIFYSRASLAKGTIYLFTLLLLLQSWFLLLPQWRRKFLRWGGGLAVTFGFYCIFVLATHPSSIFLYKAPDVIVEQYFERLKEHDEVPQILTNADHSRLFENSMAERALNRVEKFINFFAYRVFFVPAEVSHFWYMYYPNLYGDFLGFYGLSPSSRNSPNFVHPANRLGLWAYRSRFPDHYFESVRAYCSIDADAYSRWGFLGVIALALLLFIMRILWKLFRIEGQIGTALYASLLFVLGSALPAASLFAILLANGVFMYFIMLFFISMVRLNESF